MIDDPEWPFATTVEGHSCFCLQAASFESGSSICFSSAWLSGLDQTQMSRLHADHASHENDLEAANPISAGRVSFSLLLQHS
jgi:hypothetical protein